MPDPAEYEKWLEENRKREEQERILAKREANVEAKLKAAPVQMNWYMKSPAFYHKELTAKYANSPPCHRKDVASVYSEAQREQIDAASLRRDFMLEARRVFRLMDKDRSRGLEHAELKELTSSDMAAEYLIDLWDTDGDGKVQMHEWIGFMAPLYDDNPDGADFLLTNVKEALAKRAFETDVRLLFNMADRDGSGHLDFNEVMELCADEHGSVSFASFEMFYEGMDQNEDFMVDADEWASFMTRVYESSPEMAFMLLQHYARRLELRSAERAWTALADELFQGFDADGDGKLSPKEVLEFTDPEADADERWQTARSFVAEMDWDASGSLDLDEWREFMTSFWRRNKYMAHRFAGTLLRALAARAETNEFLEEAQALFKEYDIDGNGSLSIAEMIEMLGASSVPAVLQFMSSFDSDMSGSIELDEWRSFCEKAWAANKPVATRFIKTLRYKLKRKRAAERAAAAQAKETKHYY